MIKFELPDGDASALHHIGVALQNIAADMGHKSTQVSGPQVVERTRTVGDMSVTETFAEVDTVSEQYASLAKDGVVKREGPFYWSHSESDSYGMVDTEAELIAMIDCDPLVVEMTEDEYNALSDAHGDNPTDMDVTPPPPVEGPTDPKSTTATDATVQGESAVDHVAGVETDTNGLPWDKRIHSANRTKNADGSWRNARQPKAFDGDWAEYIKSIEAELRGAMSGQVDNNPPPPADNNPPPPVTETVVDDTPPPPADDVPPPPVVEEPTPFDQAVTQDVPPPPSSDKGDLEPKTFPELMKLITENAKEKGAVAKVQEIIAAHNYGSLQTLSSVGAEAVTIVYHELKAKL